MSIINLGVLAHVDAGKTSLTERLLFETGTIAAAGSVDAGDTQTDSLELERERGITIQSAVVAFTLAGHHINLIDTPGHSDFIAEVERSLLALDGVVLVVSAVEGVQAQTRRLARVLRAMRVPVIVFINKIDRVGARDRELLGEIRRTLGFVTVPLSWPVDPGSVGARVRPVDPLGPEWREATIDALASTSDAFLARYVRDDGDIPDARVRTELARQARRGDVVPVLFGSAVLGVGVDLLLGAIPRYLPYASGRADATLSGSVFKVQRAANGERVVLARLHAGCLRRRDVVTLGGTGASDAMRSARVTAIERFDDGRVSTVESATGGEIVRLHGLREARIGDVIGEAPPRSAPRFDPPTLESVVRLAGSGRPGDLAAALQHLADLDPLIGLRVSPRTGELSVRLYGEVQKEVIAATLGREYGLDVRFEPSQVVCVEVPCGTGGAVERIGEPSTPFAATVGVRVEPRPTGHGVTVTRPSGALDLSFYRAIEETIVATLAEGLCGWEVTDCHVTVTETAMWPTSVASDYRNLTPLVLMAALGRAGTEVREPVQRFGLDAPVSLLGTLIDRLVVARAALAETDVTGDRARVSGTIPSAELHRFEERLPGLTGGDAGFWSEFAGYRPVSGEPPRRARTDLNPLDRVSYLAAIAQGQTA